MKEEVKPQKKFPALYYASAKDCKNKRLRSCSPSRAAKHGVFGWRSWHKTLSK